MDPIELAVQINDRGTAVLVGGIVCELVATTLNSIPLRQRIFQFLLKPIHNCSGLRETKVVC